VHLPAALGGPLYYHAGSRHCARQDSYVRRMSLDYFSPTGTLGIGKKKHILVLMTRKTNILLLSVTAVSGFHEDFF
jgi:hypothetical protein